jgi:hypothetical protein
MAQNSRKCNERVLAAKRVEITAAQSNAPHSKQHLTYIAHWLGDSFDNSLTWMLEDKRLH